MLTLKLRADEMDLYGKLETVCTVICQTDFALRQQLYDDRGYETSVLLSVITADY